MKSVDGQWKLVGLVSLGEEHRSMQTIMTGYSSYAINYKLTIRRETVLITLEQNK